MDWDHKGNFIVEFLNGSTEKMLKNDLITYCDKVNNCGMLAIKHRNLSNL